MFAEGFLGSENAEGRAVASRGAVVPGPPFETVAPPFHVWPLGCYIHPILHFKNVVPPFWFFLPCCKTLATGLADGAKKLLQKRHLAYPSPSAKLKSINSQLIITKAKEMHCFVSFVNVYQAAHSSAPKKSSRVVWIERRVKKRTVKNLYFRPAFGWFRYNGSMHLSLVNVYLFFTQKSKLTFDRFSLKTHIPATWEQSVVITHHVTARVHTLRNKLK